MRRISKKHRDVMDAVREERAAFVAAHACCVPWCGRPAQDCHEVPKGANRGGARMDGAFADVRAWLATCRFHHDELGSYGKWPLAMQFCLKFLQDRENYSRVRLNELRGKAADSIDESEVLAAMVELLKRKQTYSLAG